MLRSGGFVLTPWRVAVALTFLVAFDNVAIFAALQMTALVITSVAMRMPPWWEARPVLAANTEPGLFGLPRCEGFEGTVDASHPNTVSPTRDVLG